MNRLILLYVSVLGANLAFGGQYRYLGKEISENRFLELYASFKEFLCVANGTICDLRDPRSGIRQISLDSGSDFGVLEAQVLRALDNDALLVQGRDGTYYTLRGTKFDLQRLVFGKYARYNVLLLNGSSFVKVAERNVKAHGVLAAAPISKEEFADYLLHGNELFVYRKPLADTQICKACRGLGKVRTHNRGNRCPECDGKGKVRAEWIKEPVPAETR